MKEGNLSFDDYKEALFAIFTEERIQKALHILNEEGFSHRYDSASKL